MPFSLIVWGQTQIASGLAAIRSAPTPLFTVVMAHLATANERMTSNRLANVVPGALDLGERSDPRHFIGMALITGGLTAIDG